MARGPQQVGNILTELMARRGFGRVQAASAYQQAWREASGQLIAKYTRAGAVRRGKLEVTVANSTLLQELGFQKPALLKSLAKLLPDENIDDLRFRVGPID